MDDDKRTKIAFTFSDPGTIVGAMQTVQTNFRTLIAEQKQRDITAISMAQEYGGDAKLTIQVDGRVPDAATVEEKIKQLLGDLGGTRVR